MRKFRRLNEEEANILIQSPQKVIINQIEKDEKIEEPPILQTPLPSNIPDNLPSTSDEELPEDLTGLPTEEEIPLDDDLDNIPLPQPVDPNSLPISSPNLLQNVPANIPEEIPIENNEEENLPIPPPPDENENINNQLIPANIPAPEEDLQGEEPNLPVPEEYNEEMNLNQPYEEYMYNQPNLENEPPIPQDLGMIPANINTQQLPSQIPQIPIPEEENSANLNIPQTNELPTPSPEEIPSQFPNFEIPQGIPANIPENIPQPQNTGLEQLPPGQLQSLPPFDQNQLQPLPPQENNMNTGIPSNFQDPNMQPPIDPNMMGMPANMPPLDTNIVSSPFTNPPPIGAAPIQPSVPPTDLGKIELLKNIQNRLDNINLLLDNFSDKYYRKVKEKMGEAVDIFNVIVFNFPMFKDNILDIAKKYRKFITAVVFEIKKIREKEKDEEGED